MSRISSQQSASEHHSTQNIRNIIHRLKMPYLRNIDQAKYRFQEHVQQFKAHQEQSGTNPNNQQSTSKLIEQKRYSSQKQFRIAPQAQKTNTQLSCQQVPIKMKEPNLDEWIMGQNKTSLFHNMAEMNQHYTMMFDQKMKFCKASNAHNNSFIEQEKTVIERIYKQICNQSEQTVDFNRLASFFQQCPLYYTIYNIHPASLPKTIKDAAHYFEDRLTKTEFMNLFLINNRTNKDYENFNVQRKEKKCVLDEQKWEDIKEVFILFDTFGNQTVLLKQFMKKLQVSIQHKHLLEWDILSFESIGRTYTFGKILFELQDKLKISDSYFRWEQFQQMIMNFQHIREPTIDVIEKENIRAGKITNISNNFMLKTQVLDFIKEVFGRCPKYCQSFVKVSQFCNEIYQAQKSKLYLGEVVRTVPQIVTLKQVLKSLCADNYQYLDLDQIIIEFSLKIPIRNTYKSKPKMIECFESESEDEQFESTLRQKQLNKKYSEKKLKKNSSKNLFKKENTIAHQFNLSKKTKQTIRQRKLNEMLQQKEKKQQQQYSKKFKAHPIPSSTNTQNYDQYKKKQAENKEQIKQKLKKVTEGDTLLIKYLQTNTKLFQKRRKQESTCTQLQNYTFQHKPAPWFVHANLLDKIKAQKQQKSKHMLKQTNIKYLKQWKNLPFCAQSPASSLQILPQPNNYQDKNTKQIQLATTEDYSKRENKSKAKEVPNFQLLHKQFQQELNQKKTKIKPTQIMQFNLSSPKIKEKQIEQSASRLQKTVSQNRKSRIEYRTNYIGSTLKYESMIRFNHQKKILQQLQQQEIEQKERRRQKSKKMFAKLLRKQLKRQAQSTRSINKISRHTFQNHYNQKQLAQMYSRVFARPFLFQQSSQLRLKSSQQKAQRVKLQNKSSQMDKYLEQIQPHQIQYCAPNAQKVEIVSRQSI